MNIINKLNNIKVEDIKNIDTLSIKSYLIKNADVSICIILVILTIFINLKIIESHKENLNTLNTKIEEMQNTLKAVEIDQKSDQKFTEILAEFPEPISINELSQILTGYASKYELQINNYSPGRAETTEGVKINSMSISTESPDFESMINFLKEIENSPYPIRLQSWSGTQGPVKEATQSARNDKINNKTISSKINIETYEITD